jgi:hypothetical protein
MKAEGCYVLCLPGGLQSMEKVEGVSDVTRAFSPLLSFT